MSARDTLRRNRPDRDSRPNTARTARSTREPVPVSNHIMSFDCNVTPSQDPVDVYTAERRQLSHKTAKHRRHPHFRAATAVKRDPRTLSRRPNENQLPGADEIKSMKRMIKSARHRKVIMWGDCPCNTLSERIATETPSGGSEVKRRRFIVDNEPIDIRNPVTATRLISKKGLIQDFLLLPNSLPDM